MWNCLSRLRLSSFSDRWERINMDPFSRRTSLAQFSLRTKNNRNHQLLSRCFALNFYEMAQRYILSRILPKDVSQFWCSGYFCVNIPESTSSIINGSAQVIIEAIHPYNAEIFIHVKSQLSVRLYRFYSVGSFISSPSMHSMLQMLDRWDPWKDRCCRLGDNTTTKYFCWSSWLYRKTNHFRYI